MARATRHFVPGHVWYLTHQCHKMETGEHLLRCLIHIDLNMVRAGVVSHPEQWTHGGYNEIQRPRRKNILIGTEALGRLCGFNNFDEFQSVHRNWVEAALSDNRMRREECWTRSVASGSRSYVEAVKTQMGGIAIGRKIRQNAEDYELREDQPAYNTVFDVEKNHIEGENLWYWNE